jgi:uncharacterized protein
VLRGFALLRHPADEHRGLGGPLDLAFTGVDPHWQGMDRLADALVYVLVQGKFFTLFSLLFGMGFAVMATRAEAARRPFAGMYLRRSLVLLLIGLLHSLLVWSGRHPGLYALLALVLLPFEQAPRALPWLGLLAYAVPSLLDLLGGAYGDWARPIRIRRAVGVLRWPPMPRRWSSWCRRSGKPTAVAVSSPPPRSAGPIPGWHWANCR